MNVPKIDTRNSYWNRRFKNLGEIYGGSPSKVVKRVVQHLNYDVTILEIAGGYGRNAHSIAKFGFKMISTDVSHEAIEFARNNYTHPNVCYEVKDALRLDYPERYFDVVFSIFGMNVFTAEELKRVFQKVNDVLKLGGIFINTFLSMEDPEFGHGNQIADKTFLTDSNQQLVKFFNELEIRKLHKLNGFRILDMLKVKEVRRVTTERIRSVYYFVVSEKL